VDVATGRVAQIKSLWPGHGVTSQYFEFLRQVCGSWLNKQNKQKFQVRQPQKGC